MSLRLVPKPVFSIGMILPHQVTLDARIAHYFPSTRQLHWWKGKQLWCTSPGYEISIIIKWTYFTSWPKVREVIFDERSEELMGRKRTTRLLGDNNPPEFRII